MAFTLTTLSAAVAVNDTAILLASLSNVQAGNLLGIGNEIMKVLSVPSSASTPVPVLRGQEGTAQLAHPASAQVKVGATPSNLSTGDWTQAAPGAASLAQLPAAFPREIRTYSAAGAIELPRIGGDMVAIINGTAALAMTLALPSTAQDGSKLTILGNGKAAHTVTVASGLGNVGATADVITFKADQAQGIELHAVGGFWVNASLVAGAATVAGPGLA